MIARFQAWVDGLAASARFRRWAVRFPLTRPIARCRAAALFDLVAGFVYSQVLLACVRLDLFELLARDGPLSASMVAERLRLPADATGRLLDAAAALRLLRRRRGQYALGPLGAALVDHPALRAMIEHHELLYDDLRDPLALLRRGGGGGALAAFWPYAAASTAAALAPAEVAPYSALMAASQALVADVVLDAVPLRGRRCLLDVGGGEGGFLCSAARRDADLRLILFDLPAVAARGKARLAAEGFSDRATVVGGSFLRDELPGGADTVSLVRVLHDHDDATVARLLRAVHRALPTNGLLLIAEPMAGLPGVGPMADAYFGFYLLAMGRGQPRSPQRLGQLLLECGFERGRFIPTDLPIQTAVLVTRRRP